MRPNRLRISCRVLRSTRKLEWPVKAREWFLLPLFVIDEFVEKTKAGTIGDYHCDPATAALKR